MQLADSLKMWIRVGKHAQDLEHALHILVWEQVEILERQLLFYIYSWASIY
jgi:hypothetical protein